MRPRARARAPPHSHHDVERLFFLCSIPEAWEAARQPVERLSVRLFSVCLARAHAHAVFGVVVGRHNRSALEAPLSSRKTHPVFGVWEVEANRCVKRFGSLFIPTPPPFKNRTDFSVLSINSCQSHPDSIWLLVLHASLCCFGPKPNPTGGFLFPDRCVIWNYVALSNLSDRKVGRWHRYVCVCACVRAGHVCVLVLIPCAPPVRLLLRLS